MTPFIRLNLPDELVRFDWINSPQFSEKLTAQLCLLTRSMHSALPPLSTSVR